MAMRHDFDVFLCTCCVVLLANDDRCHCGDGHADRLMTTIGQHVEAGEDVCAPSGEPHFSTLACDGCGETSHGDRWETPVLVPVAAQDID